MPWTTGITTQYIHSTHIYALRINSGQQRSLSSQQCLRYFCVGAMQDCQAKGVNKQQSIARWTVYSHCLYIAAYSVAEVLSLIPARLLAYKWQEGQLSPDSDDSKKEAWCSPCEMPCHFFNHVSCFPPHT